MKQLSLVTTHIWNSALTARLFTSSISPCSFSLFHEKACLLYIRTSAKKTKVPLLIFPTCQGKQVAYEIRIGLKA